MLIKVKSVSFFGLDVIGVDVEVNIASRGLPSFDIVGLPHKSIDESRHRIKAAIQNSNMEFPNKKITVNLAPADIHKEGSFYDLPIALGILSLEQGIKIPKGPVFFGEVSLDGSIRHTKGALLVSLYAKENKIGDIFVPVDCAKEAASVDGVNVFGVDSLSDLYEHITGKKQIKPYRFRTNNLGVCKNEITKNTKDFSNDLKNIIGQEHIKRALKICAAGGHNLIMIGPPGAGKTMIARSLISILPPLMQSEAVEVTKIYSLLGKTKAGGALIYNRPFRAPHHTISYTGMVGGGSTPTPGEISLAHRGVLFMDEFSEFPRSVLEALRQPIEDGFVTVSRSRGSVTFPAKFLLVAASNPCPCGYLGHEKIECTCPKSKIQRYRAKLSGPILDRIDIYVGVAPVQKLVFSEYSKSKLTDSSEVRFIISQARKQQAERLIKFGILCNSEMDNNIMKETCILKQDAENLLNMSVDKLNLSARSYFKIIKVAKTISDLDNSGEILINHIAEAIQYRYKPYY